MVFSRMPPAPAAQPLSESEKKMELRPKSGDTLCDTQVTPPSVVCNIPATGYGLPAAQPSLPFTKLTLWRKTVELLFYRDHAAPPSAVCRMVPLPPTTHPVLTSTKSTPIRFWCVGVVCVCQVWPPSVVRNTPPWVPTAQPLLVLTKSTLYMVPRLPVRVPATHVWPPLVV